MRIDSTSTGGFALIELMVVLAIVAILSMIMLPTYDAHILKTKRAIGRGELLTVLARQEQFFVMNKQYASRLELLGYVSSPYAIAANGEKVSVSSPVRTYLINIVDALPEGGVQNFNLIAVPQLTQAQDHQCGILQISSLGVKTSGSGFVSDCW